MAKVVYIVGDDWDGLYVDGKLAAEGHTIPTEQLLAKCGIDYEMRSSDCEWLEEEGRLPEDLSDVKQHGKPWK